MTKEVHVSYGPTTKRSTVDDRYIARGGEPLGRIEVHREPFGQDGAETSARLYAATGRPVHVDVAVDLIDREQTGR